MVWGQRRLLKLSIAEITFQRNEYIEICPGIEALQGMKQTGGIQGINMQIKACTVVL